MSVSREHEFWAKGHKYEDLAREFEQNVEHTHPSSVTSEGQCVCLSFCQYCTWAASKVDYYEYRGPRVSNL